MLRSTLREFRLTNFIGINAHHEVYEDLGIHSNSVLDPSFNVKNFVCLDLPEDHPDRAIAYECVLSGTTNLTNHARQFSSGRQSPHSIAGLSASISASPKSLVSQAPISTDEQMLGVYAPISELACTGPDGPCYGENGELGFAVRMGQGSSECSKKKKRYWMNEDTASLASFGAQCTAAGEPVYECAKVGLRSFSPIDEQACPAENEFSMPAIQEKTCTKAGDAITDTGDFDFPSWDQLPEDFQNPTTSADFHSTIPISTTSASMPSVGASAGSTMAWDNDDMNFAMDMDLDLDLDLNVFGKC